MFRHDNTVSLVTYDHACIACVSTYLTSFCLASAVQVCCAVSRRGQVTSGSDGHRGGTHLQRSGDRFRLVPSTTLAPCPDHHKDKASCRAQRPPRRPTN